ncbi:tetratricopeptide repeat protein, partial [Edaphobacter aggregans]
KGPLPPVALAKMYNRLGEKEKAIEALEKAYEQHSPRLVDLRSNVFLTSLHSDPRVQAFLQKMHFPN